MCIAIMFKLKLMVYTDTLKPLQYTLAYPDFTYCNTVWYNTYTLYVSPFSDNTCTTKKE